MSEIKFYRTKEKHGYLSNFYKSPFIYGDKEWPTVEHFFQASKFIDKVAKELIRVMPSPMGAAIYGRNNNVYELRKDWDKVKNKIMYTGVYQKFVQNHDLRKKLLATEKRLIIEHTANDSYWADGGDGSGLNYLGLTLMKVRERIRALLSKNMEPPWIYFKCDEPMDSMFWRMGKGEEYLFEWYDWFELISFEDKEEYKIKYEAPREWLDFYEQF